MAAIISINQVAYYCNAQIYNKFLNIANVIHTLLKNIAKKMQIIKLIFVLNLLSNTKRCIFDLLNNT
jgi:hypothetical protein